MTDWVRLWHDMPTDPKWRVIARKSGQPLPCVIALFNLILVNASANGDERGTLHNFDSEDAAAALDMETEAVDAILTAMQGKVLDGARLSGWEKRQPKREDNSADRVKAYRERQRTQANAEERAVTQCNAPETDTDTDTEKEHNNGYAFSGKVIRLKRVDLSRWQRNYPRLDIPALLQSRDDWLADRPEPERKKWFQSTSNWLASKQQEASTKATRVEMPIA